MPAKPRRVGCPPDLRRRRRAAASASARPGLVAVGRLSACASGRLHDGASRVVRQHGVSRSPVLCRTAASWLRTHSGWLLVRDQPVEEDEGDDHNRRPRASPNRKPSVRSSAPIRRRGSSRRFDCDDGHDDERDEKHAAAAAIVGHGSFESMAWRSAGAGISSRAPPAAAATHAAIDSTSRMKPRIMASSAEISTTTTEQDRVMIGIDARQPVAASGVGSHPTVAGGRHLATVDPRPNRVSHGACIATPAAPSRAGSLVRTGRFAGRRSRATSATEVDQRADRAQRRARIGRSSARGRPARRRGRSRALRPP